MKLRVAGFVLCWALLTSTALAIEVHVQSGTLSVHADGARLSEVLDVIGEQIHLEIEYIGESQSAETVVWDHFTDLPFDKGIARLLKDWNHILVNDRKAGGLMQIYILPGDEVGREIFPSRDDGFAGKQHIATRRVLEPDSDSGDSDSRPIIDLVQVAQDSEEHIQALRELAHVEDPRLRDAVRQALLSPDPDIRLAALSTMYQALPDDPADRMELRRLATEDANPAVQAEAIEMFLQDASLEEARLLRSEIEGDGFTAILTNPVR
jgi:hypothetical protein